MAGSFVSSPKVVRTILKGGSLIFLGLLCIVLLYIASLIAFGATYTNFCNLRGSEQVWISQSIDITDDAYRLGGIGNIGIGSTRQEIVTAVEVRNILIRIFGDHIPPSRYSFFDEPRYLPGSTLGFYRVRTWNAIEFLFDENNRVTKIRITPMF